MCTVIMPKTVNTLLPTAIMELEYAAAIQKDNFYGVQFHTEKSAEVGDKILKNFIENT